MTDARDAAILTARAQRLARPIESLDGAAGRAAIVVTIAGQQLAFPLVDVQRAAVLGRLTPVPHVPPIVLGLGLADGEVHAVFDGRVWVGAERRSPGDRTPVLMLGTAVTPLVLAVDELAGTTTLTTYAPPPATRRASWLTGVTDDGVLVVDVATLLRDRVFSAAGGAASLEGVADDDR